MIQESTVQEVLLAEPEIETYSPSDLQSTRAFVALVSQDPP